MRTKRNGRPPKDLKIIDKQREDFHWSDTLLVPESIWLGDIPEEKDYRPHFEDLVYRFCSASGGGGTRSIAEFLGISVSTVYKWMVDHPPFKEAIKKGKQRFDTMKVENTLVRRALGFAYTETTTKEEIKTPVTGPNAGRTVKKITVTTYNKRSLPDIQAIIFFLKNRDPESWKDFKAIDVTNFSKIDSNALLEEMNKKLEDMPTEDLLTLENLLKKAGIGEVVTKAKAS